MPEKKIIGKVEFNNPSAEKYMMFFMKRIFD